MKLQSVKIPFSPNQQTAPPNLAVFSVKSQSKTEPFNPCQSIAPPLSALFFMKLQFVIFASGIDETKTAPPNFAELLLKVLSFMVLLIPPIYTAPPSEVAELLMKVQLIRIPLFPSHLIAPPSSSENPFLKTMFLITTSFAET